MPIIEPHIYGLWVGKQTAKGTPNTTPSKRLVQVGGDIGTVREDGSEPFSDLSKYGSDTDWVNSLVGDGSPVVQCTPTELAYLLWLFHGSETVTAVTGPPTAQKHTTVPQTGRGHWATFFKRLGQQQISRQQFNDSIITRVQIEGSQATKTVRITPRVLSLDPAEVKATDPAAAMPTDKTLLYTDGAGAFTIDTVAIEGSTEFTLVIDEDLSVVYGDDTLPFDLVVGTPTVTIAATVYADAEGIAQYNKIAYGTASPTTGAKPLKGVPALGSYSFYLKQRDSAGALNGREFKLTIPGVKWALPDYPGPNPSGGATSFSLAGSVRSTGAAFYTLDVNTANGDVAFTV